MAIYKHCTTAITADKGLLTLAMFYGNIASDTDMRQSLLTCLGHLGQSDRERNDPNCQGK